MLLLTWTPAATDPTMAMVLDSPISIDVATGVASAPGNTSVGLDNIPPGTYTVQTVVGDALETVLGTSPPFKILPAGTAVAAPPAAAATAAGTAAAGTAAAGTAAAAGKGGKGKKDKGGAAAKVAAAAAAAKAAAAGGHTSTMSSQSQLSYTVPAHSISALHWLRPQLPAMC